MGIAIEPHAEYDNGFRVAAVQSGRLVFVSGQVSAFGDERFEGVVGRDLGIEEGRRAAFICAANTLRALRCLQIDVDDVTQVVKVLGMVNAEPGFEDTATVVHGASEFFRQVFGDSGRHARSAVRVGLPARWAVEVEAVFEVGRDAS